jgi:hypothetical protein
MAIITLGANAITALPSGVGGKVLQVVQASDSTQLSTTSASLVDVGLSASITPSSASNKVLIIVDAQGQNPADVGWGNAIVRNSTVVFQTNNYSNYSSEETQTNRRASYCYLDSPSTTSATTYKLQVYCYNPGTVLMNEGSNPTTITLMEIAG